MAQNITFETQKEYIAYCEQHKDKTHVVYNGIVYDVTEFLGSHPGGSELITDHKNKDISTIFLNEEYHEHSTNAQRMLPKYKIGIIKEAITEDTQDEGESYPKITKDKIEYNGFSVDRNRGLVPQVLSLTKKQYMHMIHNAVHLPYCRLFDSDLFEGMSRNPWWRIPMIWVPVIMYLMYYGLTFDYPEHSGLDTYLLVTSASFNLLYVLGAFLLGLFVWTFSEYGLHRGVFHFDDPLPDHPFALYLHFIIHGIHHMIPMDADRLVFPPVLGGIVYSMLFPLITSIFPGNLGRIVGVGFLVGYVCYDMTHIYIHHATPTLGHFKEMKKYHNKHHYVDGDKGFGITSKIWDKVFRTEFN